MRHAAATIVLFVTASVTMAADAPQARDERLKVELFAEHPSIVTPTGLAVASDGRVFVAESHTHFRPDDYDGPTADRILILEDTDGDGRADKRTIFHEGFTHVMDIQFHHDGWLYVATRRDIHRMRDTNGDDKADEVTRIAWLDTQGNYPHNGLSGLAFDFDGGLNFGLGENLGAAYTLHGTDGTSFSGGGEGGSTYHVRPDGTKLRRVSTGWWNPYGMCTDAFGRVFGTDNDPGASPPCRLIQVIEGGDYGYEYRYGRTGLHPLICWNGEIPGTLPMIAGTGEAPGAIVAYEANAFPKEYVGNLFVPCWADHRVERYSITQRLDKGLVDAQRDILIEGPDGFRPVGIDVAPDGTVYVSDWVSSSYSLHKQGRIWRIRPKEMPKVQAHSSESAHTRLTSHSKTPNLDELTEVLAQHGDPLLIHAGIASLSGELRKSHALMANTKDGLAVLLAARRNEAMSPHFATGQLHQFLAADNPDTRFVAVKWIADDKLVDYRPDLMRMLNSSDLDYRLFRAVAAALDRLDNKEPSDQPSVELLLAKIKDAEAPVAIRSLCLRMIAPDAKGLAVDDLIALSNHADPELRLEAVRTLANHPDTRRDTTLVEVATDDGQAEAVRAAAIAGLAATADSHIELLLDIAGNDEARLRDEALRSLVGMTLTEVQKDSLSKLAQARPTVSEAVNRLLHQTTGTRPAHEQTDAWKQLLTGDGDAAAGQRIFFGSKVGTCSKCHTIDGRGSAVGPDLSKIRQRVASEGVAWLLETILQPSKQMAPEYTPWQIVTTDGKTLVGLPRRKGGNQEAYLGIDGKEFTVKKDDIEFHREMPTSIMPEGLLHSLTIQELNDLVAFIMPAAASD
ncbi:MAG: HEAT repeat domain-containing protein [Planctomycetota bacterium]|nr:HEAT repeat domain-containing protein [Planctomycetota bacterium]